MRARDVCDPRDIGTAALSRQCLLSVVPVPTFNGRRHPGVNVVSSHGRTVPIVFRCVSVFAVRRIRIGLIGRRRNTLCYGRPAAEPPRNGAAHERYVRPAPIQSPAPVPHNRTPRSKRACPHFKPTICIREAYLIETFFNPFPLFCGIPVRTSQDCWNTACSLSNRYGVRGQAPLRCLA